MRAAVFLDRDGVLNETVLHNGVPHPPASVENLVLLPGVEEACGALRDAGLVLICVTNQPDVARGTQSRDAVDRINAAVLGRLHLDAICVCWHDDGDACACRKPRPGLLLESAERMNVDLRRSVMVGDRWRDVAAGKAAGCRTVFVDRGYAETRAEAPDLVVSNLAAAVSWILERTQA